MRQRRFYANTPAGEAFRLPKPDLSGRETRPLRALIWSIGIFIHLETTPMLTFSNEMHICSEMTFVLPAIIYDLPGFFLTNKLSDGIKGISEYITGSTNCEGTGSK